MPPLYRLSFFCVCMNLLYSSYFIINKGERKLKFIKNEFAKGEPLAIIFILIVLVFLAIVLWFALPLFWPPFQSEICSYYPATAPHKSWPC
jgi:drug/metabolite transporter (DMT)-like permease